MSRKEIAVEILAAKSNEEAATHRHARIAEETLHLQVRIAAQNLSAGGFGQFI